MTKYSGSFLKANSILNQEAYGMTEKNEGVGRQLTTQARLTSNLDAGISLMTVIADFNYKFSSYYY